MRYSTHATNSRLGTAKGMTVLEVLVSVVILTVASTVFLRFLLIGDRAMNKNLRIEQAVLCAQNEAERLKAHAGEKTAINDTLYEAAFGKIRYSIQRRTVVADAFEEIESDTAATREIEIIVRRAESDTALLAFRQLQPYDPELQ